MNFENGKDNPYDILGVPFGASIEICEASYKALIRVFHPDAFKGDKGFAEKRSIELNAAISFLKDEAKKRHYDKKFETNNGHNNQDYAEQEEESEFAQAAETFNKDWDYACKYYPELIGYHDNLKNFSIHLAALFVVVITEEKLYHDAQHLAEYLEDTFLRSKFSDDPHLRKVAKLAILDGNKRFATELNKALKILGPSSKGKILNQVSKDFPDFSKSIYKQAGVLKFYVGDSISKNSSDFGKRVEDEDFTELIKQFEENQRKKWGWFKF